jgi:hypothetical protein
VPGPPNEVQHVHDIYRMLIAEKRSVYSIANELNRRGVPYVNGGRWDSLAVYRGPDSSQVHGMPCVRAHSIPALDTEDK